MTPAAPPRVPGYELDAPSHASIVAAFARHFGAAEAEALWADACRAAGVRRHASNASVDDLRAAIAVLAAHPGLVGVCAKAQSVRLISYAMLLRKAQTAGVPAGR